MLVFLIFKLNLALYLLEFWIPFWNVLRPLLLLLLFSYLVLAKICPIRKSEFVQPEKNSVRTWIFRLNFKFEHYIFHIFIVRTQFWPKFSPIQIVRPEKIRYQSSISCPNFDIVQFIWSKFDLNLNFYQCHSYSSASPLLRSSHVEMTINKQGY